VGEGICREGAKRSCRGRTNHSKRRGKKEEMVHEGTSPIGKKGEATEGGLASGGDGQKKKQVKK